MELEVDKAVEAVVQTSQKLMDSKAMVDLDIGVQSIVEAHLVAVAVRASRLGGIHLSF